MPENKSAKLTALHSPAIVEQPAIGFFAELGWQVPGPRPQAGQGGEPRDSGFLGRETKEEVVLAGRLRAALERLNSALPPEAITAGGLIVRLLSAMRKSLVYNELLFEWKTSL